MIGDDRLGMQPRARRADEFAALDVLKNNVEGVLESWGWACS
jgi:hypothetical protein